jgi:flagellar biosynthesis protein FlhG
MHMAIDMNYAIVDTGAGYTDELISFYSSADKLFLVTTPEPTALMNVYTLAKVLASKGIFPELYLIMNQSRNASKDIKVLDRFSYVIEKFAGWKVRERFILRSDKTVSNSVIKQIPLVELHKHSQPAQTIMRLTDQVLKDGIEENPSDGGFLSKIKKMFGIK